MTKTIKETWKEEIYEIITHNETSECHSKLVALVESLISEVEALARREERNAVLSEVEREVEISMAEHNEARHGSTPDDAYARVSTIINNLRVK